MSKYISIFFFILKVDTFNKSKCSTSFGLNVQAIPFFVNVPFRSLSTGELGLRRQLYLSAENKK